MSYANINSQNGLMNTAMAQQTQNKSIEMRASSFMTLADGKPFSGFLNSTQPPVQAQPHQGPTSLYPSLKSTVNNVTVLNATNSGKNAEPPIQMQPNEPRNSITMPTSCAPMDDTTNNRQTQNQSPTNLTIRGKGYFEVRDVLSSTPHTRLDANTVYTRQGDFSINPDGYLVNSQGYALIGHKVVNGVADTAQPTPVRLSALTMPPKPSTVVKMEANLSATAAPGESMSPVSLNLFDELGVTHNMSIEWQRGQASQGNTWYAKINVEGAVDAKGKPMAPKYLKFEFNSDQGRAGTPKKITEVSGIPTSNRAGDIAKADAPPKNPSITIPSGARVDAKLQLNFGAAGPQDVTLNFGSYGHSNGITQFAGNTFIKSMEQNGAPSGNFSGLEIDEKGFVILSYDNGLQRRPYQLQLAQFSDPTKLQHVGGKAFESTVASGDPVLSNPGSIGTGYIA